MKQFFIMPPVGPGYLRRDEQESPSRFRSRAYAHLAERYSEPVDAAMTILSELRFEFASLQRVHKIQLRRPLIERHSLPYLLTHEALFPEARVDIRPLAAVLAAHTLALTHLDYHLDGSTPRADQQVAGRKVVLPSAVSYSLRMLYFAGDLASRTDQPDRLAREVLNPIAGFVISRMHEDWIERYEPILADADPRVLITQYLTSPHSRLLASGYWESMARAAYVANSSALVPEDLIHFSTSMRRLRQLVDEAADVNEDLAAGLLTLPTLLALDSSENTSLRTGINAAWSAKLSETRPLEIAAIAKIVRNSTAGAELSRYGRQFGDLCKQAAARLRTSRTTASLDVLSELKLAKLELVLRQYSNLDGTDPLFALRSVKVG